MKILNPIFLTRVQGEGERLVWEQTTICIVLTKAYQSVKYGHVCCVPTQFLHKHPGHRLGCNPKTGAEDIKGHLFFKSIEWDKLERRELKPPFKPKIVSDTMN